MNIFSIKEKHIYNMVIILISVVVGVAVFVGQYTYRDVYHQKVCVDGVYYIQFSSGTSVAYDRFGNVKTCPLEKP